MGKVHWKRYLRLSAPHPMGLSGHTAMMRFCPVLRSCRVRYPPYEPPYVMSVLSGRTAM
jgi:hypothetical protein